MKDKKKNENTRGARMIFLIKKVMGAIVVEIFAVLIIQIFQ